MWLRALFLLVGHLQFSGMGAQTLTNTNNSPVPGDVFLTHSGQGSAIGPGGTNVTWDMSTLVEENTNEYDYLSPVGTPWQSQFPTATVVEPNGTGGYIYYRASAAALEYLGVADTSDMVLCTDPLRIVSYPLSFGNSWTDDFDCQSDSSGFFGTVSVAADGNGTLIMPFGSVSNVLRTVRQQEFSFIFSFQGQLDTIAISDTQVTFYKPGVHSHVLTGDPDGDNIDWLDQYAIGMQEAMSHPIGIDLLPNPATNEVEVVYSSTGHPMTCTVLDAAGRFVHDQSLSGPTGIARDRIDLSGWGSGLYSLLISDEEGAIGVKRLIVAR